MESAFLPEQAPFNHPSEDCRPLGFQLSRQRRVAVLFWDRHVERDHVKTAPDRLIDAVKRRLVVSGDD
jgi:hypothetical protein